MTERTRGLSRLFAIALLCLLGALAMWQIVRADVPGRLRLNLLGVQLLRQGGNQGVEAGLMEFTGEDCHAAWLLSASGNEMGNIPLRDAAWQEALRCSKAYLPLLETVAPEREDIAALAVELYPQEAAGWLWLAKIAANSEPENAARYAWQALQRSPYNSSGWRMLSDALARMEAAKALALYDEFGVKEIGRGDPLNRDEALFVFARILSKEAPDQAVALYRQGLEINPYDGVRWRELADILRKMDREAAKEAYFQSCKWGDPGNHGCLNAGMIAEEQGNIEEAIQIYRLSDWQRVLDMATELEKQLEASQP